VLLVAPLVFRAPRDLFGPGCSSGPWAAARPLAVRAASFARRVVSKPGQAPPPPTGTAARPRRPRGGLQSGGAGNDPAMILRRPPHLWGQAPPPTGTAAMHSKSVVAFA